jgi:hypothetical protein
MPPPKTAYDRWRETTGCTLVWDDETERYTVLLPGATPKPPGGYRLGPKWLKPNKS